MQDDARIEQSRGFERILVKKIGADEAALRLIELGMGLERVFHFRGTGLENIEQIPVTPLKILKHVCQLMCGGFRIKPEHPVHDMVRAGLVRRIEIARFSRRFERPDDDSGRIRPQI